MVNIRIARIATTATLICINQQIKRTLWTLQARCEWVRGMINGCDKCWPKEERWEFVHGQIKGSEMSMGLADLIQIISGHKDSSRALGRLKTDAT